MDFSEHVLVALFPLVLLALVFFDVGFRGGRDLESRLFCAVALSGVCVMIAELLTWIPDGLQFPYSDLMLWATMIFYLIISVVVSQIWVLYIVARMKRATRLRDLRPWLFIEGALFALYAAYILLTPWTGLTFFIDASNVYHRGPLFFVPYVVMCVVILAGIVMVFHRWAHEPHAERRRECFYLIVFALIPVVGLVVQTIVYEWWLGWPFVAIAVLFAYINIQNNQIVTDSLTGLNNRSSLDRHLRTRLARVGAKGHWGLIMIDVDAFKEINDRFGHRIGDEVLCSVADIMRESLGKTNAFLARYGGDEFAVVSDFSDELELEATVERLKGSFSCSIGEGEQCRFALSAGGVLNDSIGCAKEESLIAQADAVLYRCKQQRVCEREHSLPVDVGGGTR